MAAADGEAEQLGKELREAAEAGDAELVHALIDDRADVNLGNWYGRTALMAAAQHGNAGIARALVQAGANINAQNKTGWTSLMYASCNGFGELVSFLMQSNADHQLQESRGRTARQMAKTGAILRLLPETGSACKGVSEGAKMLPSVRTLLCFYSARRCRASRAR
jgi:hypothetical protein|eukprot:COSAG01_NODE_2188_length_8194_cov_481.771093_6_plen_165_part_00